MLIEEQVAIPLKTMSKSINLTAAVLFVCFTLILYNIYVKLSIFKPKNSPGRGVMIETNVMLKGVSASGQKLSL